MSHSETEEVGALSAWSTFQKQTKILIPDKTKDADSASV